MMGVPLLALPLLFFEGRLGKTQKIVWGFHFFLAGAGVSLSWVSPFADSRDKPETHAENALVLVSSRFSVSRKLSRDNSFQPDKN